MRCLSTAELLALWEDGLELLPFQRALALLEQAYPECTAEEVYELSIGKRDALLFQLYRSAFGTQLQAVSACPVCKEWMQITVELDQFMHLRSNDGQTGSAVENRETAMLRNDQGQEFMVRSPNSSDLAAAAGLEPEAAALAIMNRCVEPANSEVEIGAGILAPELIDKASEAMAMLDPQADCVLQLACSNCKSFWPERLDIVAFLWSELDSLAKRTLREIHSLAQAYGWNETEILSLSSRRRQLYLSMVHA